MTELQYVKHEVISLKNHAQFDEKWLQARIAEDPAILGLGDLELKEVERLQPKAGRLDMLLRDPETRKRYEVEIMLGQVDESHIIRTIEYWDIERKRYPQYDHCAVIIAESINAGFLNVISLFNGSIPLVAIQMNALRVDGNVMLHFTKILDEMRLGPVDEEEEAAGQSVDRAYWETKGSKKPAAIADECLAIIREIERRLDLKYNRYYIGLASAAAPNNFVIFRPKKQWIRAEVQIADQQL